MPTYTATFRTAAEMALQEIEAATAGAALATALDLWRHQVHELEFESYDTLMPLDEISISGQTEDELAVWIEPDTLLHYAADDLLAMLLRAVTALNAAPRFKVPSLGSDSYCVARECEAVIAKATRNPA